MHKLGELSNLEPTLKKTLRERTKGRLVARRDAKRKLAAIAEKEQTQDVVVV